MKTFKWMKLLLVVPLVCLSSLAFAYTAQDYYQAGLTLYGQAQYQKSADYLMASLQMDATNWQAYQVLGEAYYQLGEKAQALEAMNHSLLLNPNNAPLRSFVDNLSAQTGGAAPPQASPAALSAINPALEHNHITFRQSTGAGYFPAPQLSAAFQAALRDRVIASGGTGALDSINVMISYEDQLEYTWSPYEGVFLSLQYGLGGAMIGAFGSSSSNTENASVRPTDLGIGLGYERFLPDKDGRWFAKVALAYYDAHISVQDDSSAANALIYMQSGTLGATVEVGREFNLFWILGVDFAVEATYADASGFKGPYGSRTVALTTDSSGDITLVDDSQVGQSGYKYATVDYLEVCPRVSFDFHF